nr:5-bromo-4-chloroindolyl phosphate hydrolysis family protein [Thiocystis minor]
MYGWRQVSKRFAEDRPGVDPSPTGWLLFLLPLPVAAAALISMAQGQTVAFLGDAIGYGLFLGGALLMRLGRLPARSLARARWPFKTLGSVLVSLATGVTVWLGIGHPPAIAAAFAAVALLGCYLTYGFDPRLGYRFGRRISASTRTTLAEADRSLAAIHQAIGEIRQPEINIRLRRIAGLASEILQRLEADPRDLPKARTFLNVYLDGVQSVVEGYAKTQHHHAAPDLEERFRGALIMIEAVFREQQQKLLESDMDYLDVQIDVLMQQLRREGLI